MEPVAGANILNNQQLKNQADNVKKATLYARASFCNWQRIQDLLESILKLFDVAVKECQVLYLKKNVWTLYFWMRSLCNVWCKTSTLDARAKYLKRLENAKRRGEADHQARLKFNALWLQCIITWFALLLQFINAKHQCRMPPGADENHDKVKQAHPEKIKQAQPARIDAQSQKMLGFKRY